MNNKKLILFIIPVCILLGAFLVFNFVIPKDFKKIYNQDNDLVTTFFQLYKTDFLKDEKTVNDKNNNIHYKRHLIGGDLRSLSIREGVFLYSYTIAPKGKSINFTIQVTGKNDALSGEILKNNKLSIRNFNSEVTDDKTQSYYEKKVISNLKVIFNEIAN